MVLSPLSFWFCVFAFFFFCCLFFLSQQFLCCGGSVAQLCPTLCNPMDCSTPGLLSLTISQSLSNSCLLSQWCHPTISSSVTLFSSCLQSFPASVSFPMCRLFKSGGQSIGVSASASVLPMNIHGWFPLCLTGLIALVSKGLSRVFSNTTVWKHQFFSAQPSLWSSSYIHLYMTAGKMITLIIWTFVGKVLSLLFNMLSRLLNLFFQGTSVF